MSDDVNEAGGGAVEPDDSRTSRREPEPAEELASLVAGFRAQLG